MKPSVYIPLPGIERSQEAKVHPYPFQIARQTLEFMQGSLFYASFVDIASGAYVRQPDGMKNIERIFIERLDSKKIYDDAWGILEKYLPVFEKAAFQSVVIAMNSHWDWYARKLIDFVSFARQDLNKCSLAKNDAKRLVRFSSLPICEQLEIIEVAAGIKLALNVEEINELQEMTLVRNLGLHNRWEIDKRYLERTSRSGYQLGELRIVEIDEVGSWHQIFNRVVQATSVEVALAFVSINDYP